MHQQILTVTNTHHTHTQPEEINEPVSVLLPLPQATSSHGNLTETAGIVEWQPPHVDWHPWAGRSAYSVGEAYSNLDPEARAKQISDDLYVDLGRRKGEDPDLQKVGVVMLQTVYQSDIIPSCRDWKLDSCCP